VTTITYYTLTRLHWLISQLSITVSNYHTLPVLSPIETSLVGLLLTNWLVGLLPENWLCIAAGLQDISPTRTPRKRPLYCWAVLAVPSNGHCVVSWRLGGGGKNHKHSSHCCVWQDGGSSSGNHVNTCDVIAGARRRPRLPAPPRSLCLVASCLADGCLATLHCATQQLDDMSQYYTWIPQKGLTKARIIKGRSEPTTTTPTLSLQEEYERNVTCD
jgi:hypothetical protein